MHFASWKVFTPHPTSTKESEGFRFPIPNTNIISVDLGVLSNQVKLFTGDPNVCQNCEAIFNSTSVVKSEGDTKLWKCEFCGHINTIDLEEEEIPSKEETFDYMLVPPQEKEKSDEEKILIFCLDISGSMCVTSEIVGNLKIKGDKHAELSKSLNQEALNQWLPQQRRDVTYISRLQCVQAAIDAQLEKLKQEHPNYKVSLVVFNHEVTILGDGTVPPIVITGDKLNDFNTLLNIGATHQMVKSVFHSKDQLVKKLYELDESGATALGPALVVALGIAQSSPGSTIVLATDGLANTGVGTLDPPSEQPTSILFYDHLTQHAKDKSISINILGIRGDSININVIGRMADGTSGIVDLVDPEKITENFSTILESKLVGTNVSVKLFLHKGFQFPDDEEWKKKDGNTFYAVRHIGNAYEDTEITAEFKPKSKEEISDIFSKEEMNPTGKIELPFQVQIEYTAPSGMKCLRVITRKREITTDQSEVIKNVDVALLGMHANNSSAKMAQRGDVLGAMKSTESYGSLMQTNTKTESEIRCFEKWSMGNINLFSSPQIKIQQCVQEQQMFNYPGSLPPQQQQQQNFVYKRPFHSTFTMPPTSTADNKRTDVGLRTQTQTQTQQTQTQQTQTQPPLTGGFTFGNDMPQPPLTGGFTFGSGALTSPQAPQPARFTFSTQPQAQLSPPHETTSFNDMPQPPITGGFTFGNNMPQPPLTGGFTFGSGAFTSPQAPQPNRFTFSGNVAEPSLLSPSSPQPQTFTFNPPNQSTLPPIFAQSTFPQPLQHAPQPLPQQQLAEFPQTPISYDDSTSNQIYQQMNVRKNKNIWDVERKF